MQKNLNFPVPRLLLSTIIPGRVKGAKCFFPRGESMPAGQLSAASFRRTPIDCAHACMYSIQLSFILCIASAMYSLFIALHNCVAFVSSVCSACLLPSCLSRNHAANYSILLQYLANLVRWSGTQAAEVQNQPPQQLLVGAGWDHFGLLWLGKETGDLHPSNLLQYSCILHPACSCSHWRVK